MSRKGSRKPRVPVGDPGDARGFAALLAQYADWLRVRNYSEATVGNREHYVGEFAKWCAERSITRPAEVTKPLLERYQRWLYAYRQKNGKPLTFPSQLQHLIPVRAFFKVNPRANHSRRGAPVPTVGARLLILMKSAMEQRLGYEPVPEATESLPTSY